MKETVYYKPQIGRETKDVLREITPADQQYIKKVMDCYRQLADVDPRPAFGQWFDEPNPLLPRQPKRNNERNSPRSFCDGIIDKLNQAPNRRDLSPKQCDGIEALSQEISQMFERCPKIEFKNKLTDNVDNKPKTFNKLFK